MFSGHLSLHDCQNSGINRVYGDATILSTDCSGETRLVLHAPSLSQAKMKAFLLLSSPVNLSSLSHAMASSQLAEQSKTADMVLI